MQLRPKMNTGFYNKVKNTSAVLTLFLNVIIDAQPLYTNGQTWPKLMQLYEDRVVELKNDSVGKFFYADWQGNRIKDLKVPNNAEQLKYLYVDSTGKPLSTKRYQNASNFYDGLASVWEAETLDMKGPNSGKVIYGKEIAIINTKEEIVLPMDKRMKYSLGKGLIVCGAYTDQYTAAVYNKIGKKLMQCTNCSVGMCAGMDNFWVTSSSQGYAPHPTTNVFDLKGKLIFSGTGKGLEQIYNYLPTRNANQQATYLPFYRLKIEEQQIMYTILDHKGKVVIDSVGMSYFRLGKCEIYKNGFAAVVDTNWKIIVPFSYGYNRIQILDGHPQNAYLATKNNRTTVITADNKKLIPFESEGGMSYMYRHGYYYEGHDVNWNSLLVNMKGDTVISSSYYERENDYNFDMPGFFVKSKANGLKGYLDENGEIIIPCEYDNLIYTKVNLILFFSHGGNCGYMDLQGKEKISMRSVSKLSTFGRGYALCLLKVTDKKQFRSELEIIKDGDNLYQFQEWVIDSVGHFLRYETYPPTLKELYKVLSDGSQITSYFYKGVALVYNAKKNKYGLVNENLQLMLPVIYDAIDTKAESFEYTWYNRYGSAQQVAHQGISPNVLNGKVKVTLNGLEKIVELKK